MEESCNGSDKVKHTECYNFDIKHTVGVINEVAVSFAKSCEQTDINNCPSINEDEIIK